MRVSLTGIHIQTNGGLGELCGLQQQSDQAETEQPD